MEDLYENEVCFHNSHHMTPLDRLWEAGLTQEYRVFMTHPFSIQTQMNNLPLGASCALIFSTFVRIVS